MFKRVLLLVLFAGTMLLAQPTGYFVGPEYFDSGLPAGWTIYEPVDFGYEWTWAALGAMYIDCSTTGYENDWLIAPEFDASDTYDSVMVEFWHQTQHWSIEDGAWYALLSLDGGVTWPGTLFTEGVASVLVTEKIRQQIDGGTIPHVAALTANTVLAFNYAFVNSGDLYLDSVTVEYYVSEPAAPTFTHLPYYHESWPRTVTEYPETVMVNDATGVDASSVEVCYDVDAGYGYSGYFTCLPAAPIAIDGAGVGTYYGSIPQQWDWSEIMYYFKATDTDLATGPTEGISDTFTTIVIGTYYAYDWTDVTFPEHPDLGFVDISGIGTDLLISADDDYTVITLPFTFTYFGQDYTELLVCTNGYLSFNTTFAEWGWTNYSIPTTGHVENYLGPYTVDLVMTSGGVYTYTSGDGDTLYIMYDDAIRYSGGFVYFDFEVILVNPAVCDEAGGNGEIIYQYASFDPFADATIGVENETGEDGTQYLYNGTYNTDPMLIVDGPAILDPAPSALKFSTNRPVGGFIMGTVTLFSAPSYEGTIVTADDGVTYSFSDYTNTLGQYFIEVLPGTYDVTAEHGTGWTTAESLGITVARGETVVVDFTLDPIENGYVCGYIDLTDVPGPDAGLSADLLGGTAATAFTDAAGMYVIEDVAPGTYATMGSFAGYSPRTSEIYVVMPNETTYVDTIFLEPSPYGTVCNDFETDDGGLVPLTASAGTGWEWGDCPPTATFVGIGTPPAGAASGTHCWGTDLNDDYINMADWYLFKDISTLVLDEISFMLYTDIEDYFDGAHCGVSYDGGATYVLANSWDWWYDDVVSTSFGNPMGGDSTWYSWNWVTVTVDMTAYPGATDFLWRLATDSSVDSYAGFYIDDLCVTGLIPTIYYGCVEGYVYDMLTYEVIPGATVEIDGLTTVTDASGHYMICDVPQGYYWIEAGFPGYLPNGDSTIIVDEGVTGPVNIPLAPPTFDPPIDEGVEGELSYGEDGEITIEICNPYDTEIMVGIAGTMPATTLYRSTTTVDDMAGTQLKKLDADKLRADREIGYAAGKPIVNDLEPARGRTALARAKEATVTEVGVINPDVYLSGLPWGMGCYNYAGALNYWISMLNLDMYHIDAEFDAAGNFTMFSFIPGWSPGAWFGDMCFDGTLIWQISVGGDNAAHGFDPMTGVEEAVLDDPTGYWDFVSQRGIAYDPADDIFFVGGWNDNVLYVLQGFSWPDPGDILFGWAINDIAGIGYNKGRRTCVVAMNNPGDDVMEFDPLTGIVVQTFTTDWGGYANAGCSVDADGIVWIVSMLDGNAHGFDIGTGAYPVGVGAGPSVITIGPNECEDIVIYTGGTNVCGTYDFFVPIILVDGTVLQYPVSLSISPPLRAGWNLVAFPILPTVDDFHIQLHDDIVPFYDEMPNSMIWTWDAMSGAFVLPTGFQRGRGYMLAAWHNNTHFDIMGTHYLDQQILTLPYYGTSSLPGWNMVGNPVNYVISWDYIAFDAMFSGLSQTFWKLTDNGWRTYNPFVPVVPEDKFIDPYQGIFVRVFEGMTGILPMGGTRTGSALFREMVPETDLPDFLVGLNVTNDGITDAHKAMATFPLASNGLDMQYDGAMPPALPNLVQLGHFVVGGTNVITDVKTTMEHAESKTWYFVVDGAVSGTDVVVTWENMDDTYAGYTFTLYDPITGETVDMRSHALYSFTYTGERTLQIIVNATMVDVDEHTKPETAVLEQNVPNPFNAATQISFNLKGDEQVTLEVFDLQGKKISTLINGELESGNHSVIWDGTNANGATVNSGVYLYRLKAGDVTSTRKMMLVK